MTLLQNRVREPSQHADDHRLLKVAIVGRGFTGTMMAIAILRSFRRPFHLVMFDPQPRIDGGGCVRQAGVTAFNSRVRHLSLDPDVPDDFRTWLETSEAGRASPGDVEDSFVSDEVFSAYVYQRFSEALKFRRDVVVQISPESVTAIDRHPQRGLAVLAGNRAAQFDAVFLATGYGHREKTEEPASPSAVREAAVVGSGIYAVERALRLLAEKEAAHVTLISPSRFLPQSHARAAVGRSDAALELPGTLRGAFRVLRQTASAADAEGLGWQSTMNSFRLRAHDLWQQLSGEERRRFARHVKTIYDSHRNRLPPEHYRQLHEAIASGAIDLKRAKVERIATNGLLLSTQKGLEVFLSERTIDCRLNPADLDSPLFRSVLGAGLAKRDEIDLGLLVDKAGRAIAESGAFHGLFAIGPLGLGSLPDIDLVPEIVKQTQAAASMLDEWVEDPAEGGDAATRR